jgi:hypothetical protein
MCGATRSRRSIRTFCANAWPGGKKLPLFSLVLFMHWIGSGLDRGCFHWSDDVPGWL